MSGVDRTQAIKKALTPKDCEIIYGLNTGTLANLRFFKRGPRYYKLGKKILYRVEDIEAWLNSNIVLTLDAVSR